MERPAVRGEPSGVQTGRPSSSSAWSLTDDTNYEASDLLFLNGDRFMEEIEVNLIELPVSVSDGRGRADLESAAEGFFRSSRTASRRRSRASITHRIYRSPRACSSITPAAWSRG